MHTKSWNLKLTPTDGPAETVRGLSHAEAVAVFREVMDGVPPSEIAILRARAVAPQDTALAA